MFLRKLFLLFLPVIFIDLLFDGEELSKFTFLIKHYSEHSQTDKIDFWRFLRLHYGDHQHSSSSQEHEKLPFKDHHHCAHVHVYLNKEHFPQLKKLYPVRSFDFSDSSDDILYSCFFSVWHPPRV
jgi:hypothetical protein